MPLLREPSIWIAAALALIVGAAALLAAGRRRPRPAPGPRASDPAPWRADRRDEDRGRDDAARDQLLALLVRDPDTAVRAVADLAAGAAPAPVAVRLLRSGVVPAAVARVCGVPEGGLADLVAGDLGLLGADGPPQRTQGPGRTAVASHARAPGRAGVPGQAGIPGRTGRKRTDEPGATWARAGSPAGSTTATTG